MRGVAPLLVAAAGWLWFGELLSPGAWTGVLLICGGVLSLGMAGGGANRKVTALALFGALIICVYTIAGGAGVRVAGGAERYVVWLFMLMGLPFGLFVLALERGAFLRHAARHWVRGLTGASLSGLSYGIALWAMTRAPVAAIAALRETSVIFAALIGAWILKEGHVRTAPRRGAAVLAGVIASNGPLVCELAAPRIAVKNVKCGPVLFASCAIPSGAAATRGSVITKQTLRCRYLDRAAW